MRIHQALPFPAYVRAEDDGWRLLFGELGLALAAFLNVAVIQIVEDPACCYGVILAFAPVPAPT